MTETLSNEILEEDTETLESVANLVNTLNPNKMDFVNQTYLRYVYLLIDKIKELLPDVHPNQVFVSVPGSTPFLAFAWTTDKKYKLERIVLNHGEVVQYIVGAEEVKGDN